jgi:hypothetical protein
LRRERGEKTRTSDMKLFSRLSKSTSERFRSRSKSKEGDGSGSGSGAKEDDRQPGKKAGTFLCVGGKRGEAVVLHALGVFVVEVVREVGGRTMLFCSAPAAAAYQAPVLLR